MKLLDHEEILPFEMKLMAIQGSSLGNFSLVQSQIELFQEFSQQSEQILQKILVNNPKSLFQQVNSNLKALSIIILKMIYEKNKNKELLQQMKCSLYSPDFNMEIIKNHPHSKIDNLITKKILAQFFQLMNYGNFQNKVQLKLNKYPIVLDLLVVYFRVVLNKLNVTKSDDYMKTVDTEPCYRILLNFFDLNYKRIGKIYLFAEDLIFLASHDNKQFTIGDYQENNNSISRQFDSILDEQCQSEQQFVYVKYQTDQKRQNSDNASDTPYFRGQPQQSFKFQRKRKQSYIKEQDDSKDKKNLEQIQIKQISIDSGMGMSFNIEPDKSISIKNCKQAQGQKKNFKNEEIDKTIKKDLQKFYPEKVQTPTKNGHRNDKIEHQNQYKLAINQHKEKFLPYKHNKQKNYRERDNKLKTYQSEEFLDLMLMKHPFSQNQNYVTGIRKKSQTISPQKQKKISDSVCNICQDRQKRRKKMNIASNITMLTVTPDLRKYVSEVRQSKIQKIDRLDKFDETKSVIQYKYIPNSNKLVYNPSNKQIQSITYDKKVQKLDLSKYYKKGNDNVYPINYTNNQVYIGNNDNKIQLNKRNSQRQVKQRNLSGNIGNGIPITQGYIHNNTQNNQNSNNSKNIPNMKTSSYFPKPAQTFY